MGGSIAASYVHVRWVLAPFTVGNVYASLCKKGAYAPFSAQRRSRTLIWLYLMHRRVLASSHQHLMEEAPTAQYPPPASRSV